MGFEPYLNNVRRYGRTFQVLNPDHFVSPFYFMVAATTGVAGHVVQYHATQEDTVQLAVSGILKHQVAGFLLQDVKDLDAGPVKGYRNKNNTVENLGGNVGVMPLQPGSVCYTKQYTGTMTLGIRLTSAKNAGGNLEAYSATVNTGDPLAVVEAVTGSAQVSLEPQQLSAASGNAFIRIRVLS